MEELVFQVNSRAQTIASRLPEILGGGSDPDDSPVWMRAYSAPNDAPPKNPKAQQMIDAALFHCSGDRMVVGHTVQKNINGALNGKAWRIDVGASKGVMSGQPEVLEVTMKEGREVLSILTKTEKVPGSLRLVGAKPDPTDMPEKEPNPNTTAVQEKQSKVEEKGVKAEEKKDADEKTTKKKEVDTTASSPSKKEEEKKAEVVVAEKNATEAVAENKTEVGKSSSEKEEVDSNATTLKKEEGKKSEVVMAENNKTEVVAENITEAGENTAEKEGVDANARASKKEKKETKTEFIKEELNETNVEAKKRVDPGESTEEKKTKRKASAVTESENKNASKQKEVESHDTEVAEKEASNSTAANDVMEKATNPAVVATAMAAAGEMVSTANDIASQVMGSM